MNSPAPCKHSTQGAHSAATSASTTLPDSYLRDFAQGNQTTLDVAAPPAVVWAALHQLRLNDCRTSRVLLALRALPGRLTQRGAYGPATSVATATDVGVLESMTRDRFITLDQIPGEEIVLGVIGQFWRLNGGTDAPVGDVSEFVAFNETGFVKVAANFSVEATTTGSRLSTETRCVATDPATARRFALYWALIGWGSKLIRWDADAIPRSRGVACLEIRLEVMWLRTGVWP